MRLTGPLESAALLTVLPVPAPAAASTRGVLPWAPLVGLVLGGIATVVAVVGDRWASPLVGAVLAIASLAVLTRGLRRRRFSVNAVVGHRLTVAKTECSLKSE